MKHIEEEDLVAYACADMAGDRFAATKSHFDECRTCAERLIEVRSILDELGRLPIFPPPAFAWSRLRARVEASDRSEQSWDEPRWLGLALAHVGAVLLASALIVVVGGWLSSSELWVTLAQIPAARAIGPTGTTALCFFGVGALAALALTPVLWWDSRSAGRLK